MLSKRAAYRGCLLGLAVGDAMGYTVDTKTWAQIQEDYGPNGLLGYDLVNGYADVTSHTQLAAFTCNGLLLGMTRGQLRGIMAPYVRYVGLAHQEWSMSQRRYDQPDRNFCWVFKVPELRRRRCTDTRMMDTIDRNALGTPEEPRNKYDGPAAIANGVAVGLFANHRRMDPEEADRLGAEAVALTHGSPDAFLPGAVLAHLISAMLSDSTTPIRSLMEEAVRAVEDQFGSQYPQSVGAIAAAVQAAFSLADNDRVMQRNAMEQLQCETSVQVLAGAFYACLTCQNDFDSAMITSVNHSGRSSAVGCLTGAILGARMGEEALPEFYMECLEPADALRSLADDLFQGCPMEKGNRLFEFDWDRKYIHGEP